MSAPPPNNTDPSSRFSFDDPQPRQQQSFGVNPYHQSRQKRGHRNPNEQKETLKDEVIDEVDEALGITDRLLGCSWWLLTLPFRLIWKVIEAVTDVF